MSKKPKLGSGKRFKALTDSGMSPALAAHIGRKKYGKKKMAKMAAAGSKRAAAKRLKNKK
jgi:hypothetical protein